LAALPPERRPGAGTPWERARRGPARSLPAPGLRRALAAALLATSIGANGPAPSREEARARDIYRELIEENTVTSTGDTARAAQAMAKRLTAAGFPEGDVQVFTPAPHKGNLVARLRGTGARRPILLVAHLDVVEARREDWSTDPFKLVEKDGYFYGRGTIDDKLMASAFVSNLIRYKEENFRPARDIVLVLETDEEILDHDGVGMSYLVKNHRDLIDAEFALNEGGDVALRHGKPVVVSLQTSEKVPANFVLEVRNKGGHSALPTKDNAIYHLAEGLTRLSKFDFPVKLNDTTRAWFERMAALEDDPTRAADMREVTRERPDPAAVERLSAVPRYNAQMRTTCVATILEGGHAFNALPQLARATVNCRVLPGESMGEVERTLVRVVADEAIRVTPDWVHVPSDASPLEPGLLHAVERLSETFWPGVPVVPTMAVGATDGSFLRNAGIPTYGHSGIASDMDDVRIHGKDERVSVSAFDTSREYLYRLVKLLASGETS
jgi:acetylornithine deacetylase/succinyl-diaminopimelate desuccinylase-like protein